jgi:hypothetical protein
MRSWFPPFADCAKDGAPRLFVCAREIKGRATRPTTTKGKGTASAVPHRRTFHAALAAEGQRSSLNPGKAEQYLYSAGFSTNPRFTGF